MRLLFSTKKVMANHRLIIFALFALTAAYISKSQARPRASRDLFAEYENGYDVMNKNEESFNVQPNDYESKARDYEDDTKDYEEKPREDEETREGCNGPKGSWLC